jgi:hypothetical protein
MMSSLFDQTFEQTFQENDWFLQQENMELSISQIISQDFNKTLVVIGLQWDAVLALCVTIVTRTPTTKV